MRRIIIPSSSLCLFPYSPFLAKPTFARNFIGVSWAIVTVTLKAEKQQGGYGTLQESLLVKNELRNGTNVLNQAFDKLKPIGMGGTVEEKVTLMLETTVDYWTCIDLAQALEQTMRNDLWSTAERIAETASRISNKPDELVVALKKFSVYQAANNAATKITVLKASTDTTHLSKAG